MRPNPTYTAASELQTDKQNKFQIYNLTDKQENPYCLVELPEEEFEFTLGKTVYQSDGKPHLSFYKQYHISEMHGKSAYHFTWYGKYQGQKIVAHVYFSSSQTYLYSRVTDRNSKEGLHHLPSMDEIYKLRKLCERISQLAVRAVFEYVQKRYQDASDKSSELLKKLENAFSPKKVQSERYCLLVQEALSAIQDKDRWHFGRVDPEGHLLADLIEKLKSKENMVTHSLNTQGFYQKTPEPKNITKPKKQKKSKKGNKKRKNISAVKAEPQYFLPMEVENELNKIDEELKNISVAKMTAAEVAVEQHQFLEKQLQKQKQSVDSLSIEFEFNLYHRLAQLKKSMSNLFHEALEKGDEITVKMLSGFVPQITQYSSLTMMIKANNLSLCQFVFEYYPESITLLNIMVLIEKSTEFRYSHLMKVLLMQDGLELFKLMLRSGVNCRIDLGLAISTLNLAILNQKNEHVQALLEHGVDPNPSESKQKPMMIQCKTDTNLQDWLNWQKSPHKIQKQANIMPIERSEDASSLYYAARSGDVELTGLLLKCNASTKTVFKGHNILGQLCCSKNLKVNPEVLRLLIQYGADLNFLQSGALGSEQYTCLSFVAEHGDLESVRLFMELGADPNCILTLPIRIKNTLTYYSSTALLLAANENHVSVVRYLLEQKIRPIDLEGILISLSFLILKDIDSFSFYKTEDEKFYFGRDFVKQLNESDETYSLLNKALSEFSKDALYNVTKTLSEKASAFYQRDQLFFAQSYFFPSVMFSEGERQQVAIYNCGRSFYKNTEYHLASVFFQVASEFNCGNSQMDKKAESMLQKSNQKIESEQKSELMFK